MKDPELRSVSVGARGLWIDMLSLMFECDRRGHLTVNGKPVTAEMLARMTGVSTDEVSRYLQELDNSGVFSRLEDGTIYSRRQIRDEHDRTKTKSRVTKHRCNAPCNAVVTGDVTPLSVSVSVSDFDVGSKKETSDLEHATQFLFLSLGVTGLQKRIMCQQAIQAFMHDRKCDELTAGKELAESWERYKAAPVKYRTNVVGFMEKAVWKQEDSWNKSKSENSMGGW